MLISLDVRWSESGDHVSLSWASGGETGLIGGPEERVCDLLCDLFRRLRAPAAPAISIAPDPSALQCGPDGPT